MADVETDVKTYPTTLYWIRAPSKTQTDPKMKNKTCTNSRRHDHNRSFRENRVRNNIVAGGVFFPNTSAQSLRPVVREYRFPRGKTLYREKHNTRYPSGSRPWHTLETTDDRERTNTDLRLPVDRRKVRRHSAITLSEFLQKKTKKHAHTTRTANKGQQQKAWKTGKIKRETRWAKAVRPCDWGKDQKVNCVRVTQHIKKRGGSWHMITTTIQPKKQKHHV